MSEIGGATALESNFKEVNGGADGKLSLTDPNGIAEPGTLFCIKLGRGSDDKFKGGKGDNPEGKDAEFKLSKLLLAGSKVEGYSGKVKPPAGIEGLKPVNCIGCCIEGGTESPGGGRSKDCWCIWGSPFGGA